VEEIRLPMDTPSILKLSEVESVQKPVIGSKAVNAGFLTQLNLPVLDGFVITPVAFSEFAHHHHAANVLRQLIDYASSYDPYSLNQASTNLHKKISSMEFPDTLLKKIAKVYADTIKKEWFSLIVSPVTHPIDPKTLPSHYLKGDSVLCDHIRHLWASYFTPKVILFLKQHPQSPVVPPAIIVQQMLNPEASGVTYTLDPFTGNKEEIVIEACWGLNDVKNQLIPDVYHVAKNPLQLNRKQIIHQQVQKNLDRFGHIVSKDVPSKNQQQPKLSDELILHLAKISQVLHNHSLTPQKVSWLLHANHVYLQSTQTFDPDVVEAHVEKAKPSEQNLTKNLKCLVEGYPASPGIISAPARIVPTPSSLNSLQAGEIIVTSSANLDMLPALKKAAGLVTEAGGPSSHIAILAREVGLPAIVSAKNAIHLINTGDVITLNGITGQVLKGGLTLPKVIPLPVASEPSNLSIHTATKIYIGLSSSQRAQYVSGLPIDGIGIVRGELIFARFGVYPKTALSNPHKRQLLKTFFMNELKELAQSMGERPVYYKLADFHTSELRQFKGAENLEPVEENPFIGLRGASRILSDSHLIDFEAEVINELRLTHHLYNLHLLLSFVRFPSELLEIKKHLVNVGLRRTPRFKLCVTIDTPAQALSLKNTADIGIDGVFLNLNHLTSLTLGIDPNNADLAFKFDERHPAVLNLVKSAINDAHAANIPIFIAGKAVSEYADLIEQVVKWGITGVVVDADRVERTKSIIHQAELLTVK